MKIKFLLLALALSMSFTGISSEDEFNKNRKGRLVEKLNLSAEQKQQFETIMQNKREKMKAAKESIFNDTKAQLSEILSDEQMQMLESRKQVRQERKERRGPRGNKGGHRANF